MRMLEFFQITKESLKHFQLADSTESVKEKQMKGRELCYLSAFQYVIGTKEKNSVQYKEELFKQLQLP